MTEEHVAPRSGSRRQRSDADGDNWRDWLGTAMPRIMLAARRGDEGFDWFPVSATLITAKRSWNNSFVFLFLDISSQRILPMPTDNMLFPRSPSGTQISSVTQQFQQQMNRGPSPVPSATSPSSSNDVLKYFDPFGPIQWVVLISRICGFLDLKYDVRLSHLVPKFGENGFV